MLQCDLGLLAIFCIVIGFLATTGQGRVDFHAYTTVGNFSCKNPLSLERINLTERCGVLLSPCFPKNYPEDVANGNKIWDLNANVGSNVPVKAYRFTLDEFDTDFIGGHLDFANTLTYQSITNLNIASSSDRLLSISGRDGGLFGSPVVTQGGNRRKVNVGGHVDVDETRLYLNFYASRAAPRPGFNVSYCADYDQCHPNYRPILCNHQNRSMCVRNGFNNYTCVCKPGYTGPNCDIDVNECTTGLHNCAKNGTSTCANTQGNYTCTCNRGYTGDGRTCENIDECTISNPCDPNASCIDGIASVTCVCNSGFTGNGYSCTDIDECRLGLHSCTNDNTSICRNTNGSHTCTCRSGFSGDGRTCANINECVTSRPCSPNARCTDTVSSYSCLCNTGYTGNGFSCTDINECTSAFNDCAKNNTSTCTNTNGSYLCTCNAGFTGNGKICTDVNECDSLKPCSVNAMCNNTFGSYKCACNAGYTGTGMICRDINECTSGFHGCAGGDTAICNNTAGSFTCTCKIGYSGDGKTCSNINECASFPCHSNATCTDTKGSFTCTCKSGYTGNGFNCVNMDECTLLSTPCAENALCKDILGSYSCSCLKGFTGDGYKNCTDIDECATKIADCDGRNSSICSNTKGSFNCACRPGYSGDGLTCRNINECNIGNACDPKARCNDTIGSFTCKCNPGYSGDGYFCSDINECTTGFHNCARGNSSICTNVNGSFACSCKPGYTGNGITCTNVNECDNNPCHANARCTDTNGSYVCSCRSGYTGNGFLCTDIDECRLGTDGCAGNSTSICTNTNGSYTCTCKVGYTGDGRVCNNINECATRVCHLNATCTDTPGSFNCRCKSGFTGNGFVCTDINECTSVADTCAKNLTSTCTNTVGSYTCTCNKGFSGDGRTCENMNECHGDSNPCDANARCEDRHGTYNCTCLTGYDGNGTYCSDINECSLQIDRCARNNRSTCRNTRGSYTCTCNVGYTGDGRTCNNVNECDQKPCDINARCSDTIGSFECACKNGFRGNGFVCSDIDECSEGRHNCAGKNTSTCTNNNGSFACSCKTGYTGDGRRCTNINECNGTNRCDNNAFCNDSSGSYNCTCKPGYRGDGYNCTEINECREGLDDCAKGNSSICTNNNGSFTCACKKGYSGDGKICGNINECLHLRLPCAVNGLCRDTPGSYECSCRTGYSGDGYTNCTDVDECQLRTDSCAGANTSTCTNTPGSHTCTCRAGFTGDGKTCNNVDECKDQRPCHRNAQCLDTIGSYTCTCSRGYVGDGFNCTDMNECSSNPCHADATCSNVKGTYSCFCRNGFRGNGSYCEDINECSTGLVCGGLNSVSQTCLNTIGSYQCRCNSPAYRGAPPNCRGYFCPGTQHPRSYVVPFTRKNSCTRPGIVEWPNYYDGNKTYPTSTVVSWFVNFNTTANVSGIRCTFIALSVERAQDYIIFSRHPSATSRSRLATFSGERDAIYNGNRLASSNDPVRYNNLTRTYTLIGTDRVYIHFFSDRRNVSKGFQIQYEPLVDVDDCPSTNPCINGGRCVDGLFTYNCVGCSSGYTGQNCTKDVDECRSSLHKCDSKAQCVNTIGSYTCVCQSGYQIVNSTVCRPLVEFSNLSVKAFRSSGGFFLSIDFDLSEPWGKNSSFIATYRILLTNENTGKNRSALTPIVSTANILPINVSADPYTRYRVNVIPNELGINYDKAIPRDNIQPITIRSTTQVPLPPTGLAVVDSNMYFVNVSWIAPLETNRGPTIAYEIAYKLNETECNMYRAIGDNAGCGNETTIRFSPTLDYYVISSLKTYRNYNIRLRAYTTAGPGSWTNYVNAFTGIVCPSQLSRNASIFNPCTAPSAALMSDQFPAMYRGFESRYWQINFKGRGALRIVFDHLDIEQNQDYLDIGQGQFPKSSSSILNSPVVTITGNDSRKSFVYREDAINNGLVFVRFTSDLFSFKRSRGFLIHYETNASVCSPNPCLNGGTCVSRNFGFTCLCTSVWTGKTCGAQKVTLASTCTALSTDKISVTWSVQHPKENHISAITSFSVDFANNSVLLPIGSSNYVVGGLDPFQTVDIAVKARSADFAIPDSITRSRCTTREATPKIPADFNVTSLNHNSVQLAWKPLYPSNGLVTGFRIQYNQTDVDIYNEKSNSQSVVAPANSSSIVLRDFKAFRNYTITISVINGVGVGPARTLLVRTQPSAPLGHVRHVDVATKAREAILNITSPRIVTGPFTYDLNYTRNGVTQASLIGLSSPITLQNLTPYTEYHVTVYPRSGGKQGNYPYFQIFTTKEDTPGPVLNLLPNQVTSNNMVLTWNPPVVRNEILTGYRIRWKQEGKDSASPLLRNTSFHVTGLVPNTHYEFTAYAYTSAGEGTVPAKLRVKTPSAVPSKVRNFKLRLNENNTVTLTFDQPIPLNGKLLDYQVHVTQNEAESKRLGDDLQVRHHAVIPACISGHYLSPVLPTFRTISVSIAARTCAGEGPSTVGTVQTNVREIGEVRNVTAQFTDSRTAVIRWLAPSPITGPITYTITGVPNEGLQVVGTIQNSVKVRLVATFRDLNPDRSYTFTIKAVTTVGKSMSSDPINLFKKSKVLPGAAVHPYVGPYALGRANPRTAYAIENPCRRKDQLFSETQGPVTSIEILIKESGSSTNQKVDVWSNAVKQNPVPPYVTGTVQCSTKREKRELTIDGSGYVVGADTSCDPTSQKPCNGPLVPGRAYQVAFRGNNAAGSSKSTPYGDEFYLPGSEKTGSLKPGEIAAIIICVTLIVFLILFVTVYMVNKRRSPWILRSETNTKETSDSYRKEDGFENVELEAVGNGGNGKPDASSHYGS